MGITGIDHVQLAMPPGEEAAARRFYAGALGMREVVKPEPLVARGGCWFETAGAVVHLGADAGFTAATRAHPALLVDDIDAVSGELRAAGAGVEVGSSGEVAATQRRLAAQGLDTATEDAVDCCFAVQDKVWVSDPDSAPWEVYTVLADSEGSPTGSLRTVSDGGATCCSG